MKIFIFQRIEQATNCWHKAGGLVIVAEDRAAAELLLKDGPSKPTQEEWDEAIVMELAKEPIEPGEPAPIMVIRFRDTGCC